MTTYGKCNNSHAPLALASAFPSAPNIAERPEHDKIATLFRCTGGGFTNSATETTTAVAISKLSGKTDPSEKSEPPILENSRLAFIESVYEI